MNQDGRLRGRHIFFDGPCPYQTCDKEHKHEHEVCYCGAVVTSDLHRGYHEDKCGLPEKKAKP